MSIELVNISKTYGTFRALDGVNLAVPDGQLMALLGPSGSGKTTLLRIIAGLEEPDGNPGTAILFSGRDVAGDAVARRRVGFVFQHYALFRHMSVFENVAFGLRVRPRRRRPDEAEIQRRVHELLKLVQLDMMHRRYPSQLSGGQRQRVALARALAIEPEVLLLDEPFGALDARVRQELRQWLRGLHEQIHVTSVFVTHDQEEALEVADRVVVMNAGHVEQVGCPEEVFHHPASEFVLRFLGAVNLFHGRVAGGKAVFGPLEVECDEKAGDGRPAKLFVRPHDLEIDRQPNGESAIAAQVMRVQSAGPVVKVELLAVGEHRLHVEMPHERHRQLNIQPGEKVYVRPVKSTVVVDGT